MRYFILCGESSGDLHAANLLKALKQKDPEAEVVAWGGDHLEAQGAVLKKHVKNLSFMGFFEVLKNLFTILGFIKEAKKQVLEYRPDVLILVDYPAFNLRIAKIAKAAGIKVLFYISPTVWAWKEKRVELVRKHVDEMLVILPFEKHFYAKHGIAVNYVGHPLLDAFAEYKPKEISLELDQRPVVALLPGSRVQEVERLLPVYDAVVSQFPQYQFIIARAPYLDATWMKSLCKNDIPMLEGQTYDLLSRAHAAIVTSGTATLETALWKIPQVVCYKTSNFSYQLAKRLVSIKYISLVNLILDREAVPELIQGECSVTEVSKHLGQIMEGKEREQQLASYTQLISDLGQGGASENAANRAIYWAKQ